jgi:hypothetical protein
LKQVLGRPLALCQPLRLGEKSAERKQVVCRFFYVVAEATTHKEFLAQSQNPNLFCTKRRKDSAPRELPSWFGQLRCRAEKLASRPGSKEPALRKGLWVNPYGIHKTGRRYEKRTLVWRERVGHPPCPKHRIASFLRNTAFQSSHGMKVAGFIEKMGGRRAGARRGWSLRI